MKKILSILCVLLVASTMFGAAKKKAVTINLYAFTDEVPGMVQKFLDGKYPDVKLNTTQIATTDGAYQPALNEALKNGEVDMFAAEAAFVLKYSKGDMSDFVAPYKDFGIKIDKAIKDADIASYTVDIGSNNAGQVVGLGYQATGGCFIYNRTVAKKVFGSDDPKTVQAAIGGGSQSWDKFWAAAEKCAAAGCAIVSGDGDVWHAIENSSDKGWIVDDALYIDPKREAFLDISKKLTDNGWSNRTQDWTEGWFADMAEVGPKQVLGFFGPAWLINYTMKDNVKDTFGDWAVCNSPVGFFWGGTWVMGTKVGAKDKNKKAIIKEILEWITLDTSSNGLLYKWANGTLNGEGGTKDTVSSGVVMKKSDGKVALLGNQNMFEYFVPAGAYANGKNLTQHDEDINQMWRDQVRAYANGEKSRDAAIKDFKQAVYDKLGY
ncbi:MAG: carbohydrate ABC transporter substrate-binding protein [Treponema sp.]|nr:carbohydrate ABC transporter substrate-binding protein [Treponema sp.]